MNEQSKFGNVITVFIVLLFSFILYLSAFGLSKSFLENKAYDFLVKITAKSNPSKDIIVVAIDDQSVNKIGRWPWKRTAYTEMFDYMENYGGAKIIAFDSIITAYGDKKDDKEFFNKLSKFKKIISGVSFSRDKNYFISDIRDKKEDIFKNRFSLKIKDERPQDIINNSEYFGTSYTLKEIMNSVSGLGSVLSSPDKDRVIRKYEPVIYYNNNYYPSLALAIYNKLNPNSEYILYKDSLQIKTKNENNKTVNLRLSLENNISYNYIKWHKSPNKSYIYPYKTISAWKIINSYNNLKNKKQPLIPKEELKNKIVIVGVTAAALKDIRTTPIASDYAGVNIQATLIDNLLNANSIKKTSKLINILIILTAIILTMFIALTLQVLYSAMLSIILALGYFSICIFAAYPNNYALDPITPILFIFCSLLIGYGYKHYLESHKKRKVKSIIAKYVSKEIMDLILTDTNSSQLGGKRADISILFADIRNFTSISDTHPPEEVSSILNEYFGEMIPIIFENKGTVNKFIGDALMVIFGAPLENPEHPKLAVKCAVDMLEKVEQLQKKWQNENKPFIDIGIGISSGIAFVGNIGAPERMEYSAIGNTVNTASRLESFNKLYKTGILICERTYEKVKDIIESREIDTVCITQNSEPIKIYELITLKS